jgi:hypothetical protein
MNWFIARTFGAVVTAGTAATALSMPASAAAQPAHRAMPVVYNQSSAGYVSSGWRFRFVAATLKVPGAASQEREQRPGHRP